MPILVYRGKNPKIHKDAYVSSDATLIGDVEIGEHANIWPSVVIRGDLGSVRVGRYVTIMDGVIILSHNPKVPLIIGSRAIISSHSVLHSCYIGDNCFISPSCIVFEGASLGEGVALTSGSTVLENQVVPPRAVMKGNPATKVRNREGEEITKHVDRTDIYAEIFARLKKYQGRENANE